MTTKAVMKKAATASANGNKPKAAVPPDYKILPRKALQPSPTNPRRRIRDETIESLAVSIGKQGILEPLIVRRADKKYEIVCGERRWRAAGAVKDDKGKPTPLETIPCLLRELTDEQVLDIQIHENLHREDVHPMDEAYGYQFLKEKLNCDVRELALRVGKTEGYVLNRIKLNLLIEEAQKGIDDEHLPLVYALEIAKYPPEMQRYIYGEVYRKEGKYQNNDYIYVPIKGQTIPFKTFLEWIDTHIHRLLAKAPFDPKATNLRDDGLACVKCPDRTGAAVSLFEPNQIGRKEACLNPVCYQHKVQAVVQVRRGQLAEIGKVEPSAVPIVRSWCYADGKGYLGTESAKVISGGKRSGSVKSCKNAVSGIDIEADNYGQTVRVCLKSSGCKIHWPVSKNGSSANHAEERSSDGEAAERLEAHRARREEIWNAKVAEAVRVRVFKQAAERFEKKFRITEIGADFLPQLIARFWRMTLSGDANNLKVVVKHLIAEWEGKTGESGGIFIHDHRSASEHFGKLESGAQHRILFLLVHAHKGTIGHNNNYASQKEVRELAAEFGVDYNLLDAEARLEFSAKKHREVHQTYLDSVQGKKKDAKVPHLFSEKWKAAD